MISSGIKMDRLLGLWNLIYDKFKTLLCSYISINLINLFLHEIAILNLFEHLDLICINKSLNLNKIIIKN